MPEEAGHFLMRNSSKSVWWTGGKLELLSKICLPRDGTELQKSKTENFSVFSLAVDEMPSSWSSWKWWPQFVKWWRNYEWTNPQLSTADILKTWQLTETAPNMQDSLFNRIFSTSAILLIRPERGLNNTLRVWHDSSASGSLWIRVNVKLRTV